MKGGKKYEVLKCAPDDSDAQGPRITLQETLPTDMQREAKIRSCLYLTQFHAQSRYRICAHQLELFLL